MSVEPSLPELLEVQNAFGLPSPALVEKDWHVVKALSAIQRADTGAFQLVFGGGTALSRAYRLTQRMSEDIDLKIVPTVVPSRASLRKLRDNVTSALLAAGFTFNPPIRPTANRGMRAGIPSINCLMPRCSPEKERCGPRSRSRRRSGHCAALRLL